jgi:hypothetical protein
MQSVATMGRETWTLWRSMTRRPTLGPQPLHLPRLTASSFRTLATPMAHRRMFCSAAVVGEKIIVIGEGPPLSLPLPLL